MCRRRRRLLRALSLSWFTMAARRRWRPCWWWRRRRQSQVTKLRCFWSGNLNFWRYRNLSRTSSVQDSDSLLIFSCSWETWFPGGGMKNACHNAIPLMSLFRGSHREEIVSGSRGLSRAQCWCTSSAVDHSTQFSPRNRRRSPPPPPLRSQTETSR